MSLRSNRALRLLPALLMLAVGADADTDPADPFDRRPDAHAPIGVRGDHVHAAGEVMLSYRWSRMHMEGNRSRTRRESRRSRIGTPAAPGPFVVAPTRMDMDMHMFGLMVAPHERVTLMGMLPLVQLRMDHLRRDGRRFDTVASGLGDVKASALIGLLDTEHHSVHLNAGLSIPTGSIRGKDTLPAPLGRRRLPYPMQIGSGTWDPMPGLTYFGHGDELSWGAQALATLRTGRNSLGYRLGHRADLTAWLARPWTDWLSTSLRVAWSAWGNVHDEDDQQEPPFVPPNLVPTGDPDRRGGHRLDLLAGVNLALPLGPAGTHRFAVEAGVPAYQWLWGPQLETDWKVVVGWQKSFHRLW